MVKQVSLCYVVMSGKKTSDYKAVFMALKAAIPETAIQEVMLDFEVGLWRAMESVFPNVSSHMEHSHTPHQKLPHTRTVLKKHYRIGFC